jgi:hypothetical protein
MVRSVDAHFHLCLDGQEAPITLHLADGAALSDDLKDFAPGHNDLDVDVASGLSNKLPKADLPVVALLFTALLIAFNLLGAPPLAQSRSTRFRYRSLFHFKPPLRGPPTLSVR